MLFSEISDRYFCPSVNRWLSRETSKMKKIKGLKIEYQEFGLSTKRILVPRHSVVSLMSGIFGIAFYKVLIIVARCRLFKTFIIWLHLNGFNRIIACWKAWFTIWLVVNVIIKVCTSGANQVLAVEKFLNSHGSGTEPGHTHMLANSNAIHLVCMCVCEC